MLRVTVDVWPGGRMEGRRTLAVADIARVLSGAVADYSVWLEETLLEKVRPASSKTVADVQSTAAKASDGRCTLWIQSVDATHHTRPIRTTSARYFPASHFPSRT